MVIDIGVPLDRIAANATLEHQGDHYELDLVDLTTGLVLEYDSLHHADAAQRGRDSLKNVAVDDVGLVMLRVNSPLLGSSRQLIRTIAARRQTALARGCAARIAQLCAAGELRELPLRR